MSRSQSRFMLAALVALLPVCSGLILSGTANQIFSLPAASFEPGEEEPGGRATSRDGAFGRNAFSLAAHGMSLEDEQRFKIGNAIFRRLWVSAPASTESADGLGPLYNARSCQSCHVNGGRGRPPDPNSPDGNAVSLVLRVSVPPKTAAEKELLRSRRVAVIPDPVYGAQIQTSATRGLESEGRVSIEYVDVPVKFAGGETVALRKPVFSVAGFAFGPLHPEAMLSARVAPQMIGLGLLEAIPEAAIRANADPEDADQNGISGRTNEVWSETEKRVALGRFGWKAGMASVRDQSAAAARDDIGLSTSLFPTPAGDCTVRQEACWSAPNGNSARSNGSEFGDDLLALVTFYSQNLAVPVRRNAKNAAILRGKALFHASGCSGCHIPFFTTGLVEGQPHLSYQRIWPYTDLLLHDMGEGLADNRPEGEATGSEWRTPPLWGIGLTEAVSGHAFLLHDGRARNIEEAILWHGGEAQAARDVYARLPKPDREALLAFVSSL